MNILLEQQEQAFAEGLAKCGLDADFEVFNPNSRAMQNFVRIMEQRYHSALQRFNAPNEPQSGLSL